MASTDRSYSSAEELARRRSRSYTQLVVRPQPRRLSRPLGQTETPVLPSASATSVDNIFQQLHLALSKASFTLKIPDTLLVSEEGQDVLLYNDDRGAVQQISAPSPLSEFLRRCVSPDQDADTLSEFPLFVFYTATTALKVLFDPAEATRAWNSSLDHTKLMQRFVQPHCRESCKTRLIWYKTGEFKRYHMRKRGIETLLQNLRANRARNAKSTYTYASRLKRESFSPYLPYKSVLEGREENKTPEPRTDDEHTDGEYDWESLSTPLVQAERFLPLLRDVLSQFLAREDELIHEIAYDVLQDPEDQYWFLNLKWVRCEPAEDSRPLIPISPRKVVTDIRQKFSSLMAAKVPGDIPFIDMHEIQAQNVKLYMSQFSCIASQAHTAKVQSPTAQSKSALDHANSQLDSLAQSASVLKQQTEEKQRVRLESYHNEKLLDSVIARVYGKATADPLLQQFFSNMSKRELNMIKLGFTKAFTGVDNYYFKRTVKKAHEGLGIDKNQFDRFVEIFVNSLEEEGVRSADIDTVRRHLSRFSDEVIEDDM